MFFVLVSLLVAQASFGLGKPFDGLPSFYTAYPTLYSGGYRDFYQQPGVLDPSRIQHPGHGQPVGFSAGVVDPAAAVGDGGYHQQAQSLLPFQAAFPYPLVASYYSAYQGQGQPYHQFQQTSWPAGVVIGYGPSFPGNDGVDAHDQQQQQQTQASDDGQAAAVGNASGDGEQEVGDGKMADGKMMARSGHAGIDADGVDIDVARGHEMTAVESSPAVKQARIFYNSGYPFGLNTQNYKQPVFVNGNQGQKVGILNNQYLLKLASTTRNPDGTLSGAVYPEIGGGTIFNTPAGNYNG